VNAQSFSDQRRELMMQMENWLHLLNVWRVPLDVPRAVKMLKPTKWLVISHVLTDITSRRTHCATKLKTAKVMSTSTRILAILVMIYARHARKVMLIIKNEDFGILLQNAIDVYKLRDFIRITKIIGVSAFLGKHQLKQEIAKEHMD
jgi:hypothetical protein